MTNNKSFPAILINKKANHHEAIIGLQVKSILKGDLMISNRCYEENTLFSRELHSPQNQQTNRESLLRAISAWSPNVTLEMHITSIPDIAHQANGRIGINLFIIASDSSKKKAMEKVAEKYLALLPLLATFFPQAEFEPIKGEKELQEKITPFNVSHSVSIHRKFDHLSLYTPYEKQSVGFTPQKTTVNNMLKDKTIHHIFPWFPSYNDWSKLCSVLMGQLDPLQLIVRLKPSATDDQIIYRLKKTIEVCDDFLSNAESQKQTLKTQALLILNISMNQLVSIKNFGFNVGVFLLANHFIDMSLANLIAISITANSNSSENCNLLMGNFSLAHVDSKKARMHDFFYENELYTVKEAACAFRLPFSIEEDMPGVPIKRFRTATAFFSNANYSENDIKLFINENRGIKQPIYIGTEDRIRHMAVFGQTGTGKSTLLANMILQDIQAGRGLAVIDPHGELIEDIIGRIPSERKNDVILFDMLDREKPLGFNALEWGKIEERDFIIDELFLTIDRIYDLKNTGGPIFESNFRNMCKLLMGDTISSDFIPTLLEFTSCYLFSEFREWLNTRISDQQVKDFIKELERTTGDAHLNNLSMYITSKFNRFTSDTTLRRIVGQEKTSFDFEQIMNEEKIFLVNLGKGRFGSVVSALIANLLISRFKMAAMCRGSIPTEKRKEFFLYVDEAHNLPSENFCELLSEARKYKMGLVLATQFLNQVNQPQPTGNNLLSSILGNVGTIILFRMGQEDASKLSDLLKPEFSSLDINGLPNWCGYTRLHGNTKTLPPFSFCTESLTIPYCSNTASQIRKISRDKYGMEAYKVDYFINERRYAWKKD